MDTIVLSKYESVQILAARVEQLLNGAPRLIDDDTDDLYAVAEAEIALGVLPIKVGRRLPNGRIMVCRLADFSKVYAVGVGAHKRRPKE